MGVIERSQAKIAGALYSVFRLKCSRFSLILRMIFPENSATFRDLRDLAHDLVRKVCNFSGSCLKRAHDLIRKVCNPRLRGGKLFRDHALALPEIDQHATGVSAAYQVERGIDAVEPEFVGDDAGE